MVYNNVIIVVADSVVIAMPDLDLKKKHFFKTDERWRSKLYDFITIQ